MFAALATVQEPLRRLRIGTADQSMNLDQEGPQGGQDGATCHIHEPRDRAVVLLGKGQKSMRMRKANKLFSLLSWEAPKPIKQI